MTTALGKTRFVAHDHHRHSILHQTGRDIDHLVDHLLSEGRGRFVEQHDDRILRRRTCDGHALLLAAGQLTREIVFMGEQADAVQVLETALRKCIQKKIPLRPTS